MNKYDVCVGLDLLEELVISLKENHFDYVCLSTDPGLFPGDLPSALFVKAVNSSRPENICNFAALNSEKDAEAFFSR